MEKIMEIQDESGDKKYFTIIPNYILNHSTANDQALYLQMKRIAGDNGTCEAGYRYFCNQLQIGYKAYKKALQYLSTHNWITFIGEKEVLTDGGKQKIFSYKVNDIWKINNRYYKGGVESKHLNQQGGVESNAKVVSKVIQGGVKSKQKKNYKEELIRRTDFFPKKLKPFYEGYEMRKAQGKWWVLKEGDWLEFAAPESEIEWK